MTPRLILRPFRVEDVTSFHAYRSDPVVSRFQGWEPPTYREAQAFVQAQAECVPGTLGAGAQIAIELRTTNAMIGDVFLHTPSEEPKQARIGFTIARDHQRRGFATEAVGRLLEYVFDDLKKHGVSAVTLAGNEASVALLVRVGMRRKAHHVRSVPFEGAWADEYVYALLRDEWAQRAATGRGRVDRRPRADDDLSF